MAPQHTQFPTAFPLKIRTTCLAACPTALMVWRGQAWQRPIPVLVVELGVVGRVPARTWLVCN